MKSEKHRDKVLTQYNDESGHYDAFHENSENAKITNASIERILKKYNIKTVLDMTCGTGSQVFWLAKHGYEVTGSDITPSMLKIAKQKAKQKNLDIDLIHGDMRSLRVGEFDAVITIFNAVGHLTKAGFERAMRNIHRNLSDGGIYVFDIINLNFLAQAENIIKLSYEHFWMSGNTSLRELQHSIVDKNGALISYTTTYETKDSGKTKGSESIITLQLYTANELKEMLARNGFKVLGQYGIDGSRFSDKKTERILTVAKKVNEN